MGTIEDRGNGKWKLVAHAGLDPVTGKYRRIRKTVEAKNKTEAKKLLAEFEVEVNKGLRQTKPNKLTLESFIPLWIDNYASDHLSPNTLETYQVIINAHILPYMGKKRMDKLKPLDFIQYFNNLEGLSPASVHYHHRVLKNLFSRAVEWQLIVDNPLSGVKKPKLQAVKDIEVYTVEEVKELFKLLEKEEIHHRLMVKLAILAGLRRGEILGLQWDDIHFPSNTIRIKNALIYTKENGYQLKDPKTKGSKRSVVVPGSLIEELSIYHSIREKEKDMAGELWLSDYFYVFSDNVTGKPLYPTSIGTWWSRFITRINKELKANDKPPFRKIRFHDLRHTAATLLISEGLPVKVISDRLGHSKISTTMDTYGHYIKTADEKAAESLDKLFNTEKDDR